MKLLFYCLIICGILACSSGKNNQINEEQQTLNEMKQSLDTSNIELVLERDTTP